MEKRSETRMYNKKTKAHDPKKNPKKSKKIKVEGGGVLLVPPTTPPRFLRLVQFFVIFSSRASNRDTAVLRR